MTADFAGLPGGALVVGGSGGIGRRVAEMLLERGARVAVTHRTRPAQVGEASYAVDLNDRREVGLDDEALGITRRNIPLRRFGSAADIAEAVCFLASPRAGFISGQKLDVDGGYSA